MRYAVVSTKGGVGKTTTAVHLAAMFAREGKSLLIDADRQASAAAWVAWRRDSNRDPSPAAIQLYDKAVHSEGLVVSKSFDNTIVYAGGKDSQGLRSALLFAEVAIVPVGASNFDAAALADLLDIVELSKHYNPSLKVKILLSRLAPNPASLDTKDMVEYLIEQKFDLFNSRIHERVAFRRSTREGATVDEMSGSDYDSAAKEMSSFFNEVKQA